MPINFIISYILAFFICLYVGEVFYLKSDRGLFTMVGLVPILNIITAFFLVLAIGYILVDIHVIDRYRKERSYKGRYNKIDNYIQYCTKM